MRKSYDLVVIGSGPAGEKGAAQAAYFGRKTAIIERAPSVGGTGINTGTIPSKTLREAALYFSGLRQRGLYGIDYSLRDNVTINDLMYRKNLVVKTEWKTVHSNIARHGIDLDLGPSCFQGCAHAAGAACRRAGCRGRRGCHPDRNRFGAASSAWHRVRRASDLRFRHDSGSYLRRR